MSSIPKVANMRTPLRTHGGKSYLAAKIVEMMPEHTRYLEAFSGGLSVLLHKPYEGISEYANDLNGELMNFWRVLRDTPERMLKALWATPLSQESFIEAKSVASTDAVKRATAFFIRNRQSRQGLGRDYCTPTTRTRRGMNENVSAWLSAIEGLPELHERLKRVEIWNVPAIEAIQALDSKDTLVYADPPYLMSTRSSTGEYGDFEMLDEDHANLLDTLDNMKGKFILSGYENPMYDEIARRRWWNVRKFSIANHASSSSSKERKIETLWSNF